MSSDAPSRRYDRAFLLGSSKRNDVLELWEVERYGRDSYGDPDYVSVYGLVAVVLRVREIPWSGSFSKR